MKKYIIAGMLLLLPTVSYAKCCDCCQKDISDKLVGYITHPIILLGTTTTVGTTTTKQRYMDIARGYVISYEHSPIDTGIKKLIGKMVHRTKPVVRHLGNIIDRSYTGEPRKLLAVTDEYLILSSDILARGQFEIDRDTWDDGNWEEVKPKPKLLIVAEAIRSETLDTMSYWVSRYYCPKCSKPLKWNLVGHYCASCKTEFDIKEE